MVRVRAVSECRGGALRLRRLFPLSLALLVAAPAWSAEPLGALRLPDLRGGQVRLGDLHARALLIDVWATWCKPCLQALPELEALARARAVDGLVVVAISQDDDAAAVRKVARDLGIERVRVLLDPGHAAAEALAPPAMPSTFLIDSDGRIVRTFSGYQDPAIVRAAVDALLDAASVRHAARERKLLGTRFSVRAFVRDDRQESALDRALELVAGLEARWSPWKPASEVSRISATGGTKEAAVVSRDTLGLLGRSLELCRLTGKAFDVTFVPLGRLYDFHRRPFVPPDAAQIELVRPLVDCELVEVDARRRRVRLLRAGMALHFGANAKGVALDVAAAELRAAGIDRFVVDGGGDVVAQGEGPKGPWRVGVQHPREPFGTLLGVLHVTGGAVATSGDYERFAVSQGRRYHHILDPRTGEPATGCMSATVVMPPGPRAGEDADAWATVLCVLGPDAGFPLLARLPGAEAAVVTPAGAVRATSGFPAHLDEVRAP